MKNKTELQQYLNAVDKHKKFRESEWYGIRGMLSYSWASYFILLGAREAGKSYSITEFFVRKWKQKKNPFYWLRLNEASMKKMLSNDAEKLVDADIYRRYDLQLKVKGNVVYDHGEKMCTVLALSTFANDKGVALFDKDFLTNNPNMYYHICLDEFQLEKTQRSQGDICYQFIQQMENILRSTSNRVRIFLVGNTLEEASDILTMFNFIPEEFGRYKLKKKKAVIDYIPPSDAYIKRRSKAIVNVLADEDVSNYSNKIEFDKALLTKQRLLVPTAVIWFSKTIKFTVWDGKVIALWNKEKCSYNIAMRPYQDLLFNQQARDDIITRFDNRGFLFKNLITNKRFQKEIQNIKPRKS